MEVRSLAEAAGARGVPPSGVQLGPALGRLGRRQVEERLHILLSRRRVLQVEQPILSIPLDRAPMAASFSCATARHAAAYRLPRHDFRNDRQNFPQLNPNN